MSEELTDGLGEAEGLRERKKRQTRHALHRAAIELVSERGLGGVTTDDIAQAAGVSPRTFFNYFPTKEGALMGVPEVIVEKVSRLLSERPDEESLWDSARLVADRLAVLTVHDEDLWRKRRHLMATHPDIAHLVIGSQRALETGLLDALVARAETRHPELAPWRSRMMGVTALNAVRLASVMGDDPQEVQRLLHEILDAHDAVYAG
ncbi:MULTISPECIES: TetR/AcrR family transcriptional regulator [unclassified Luteococcus]|uniref:TetR/AcrR family transcriptional regulator n=1 Tax=unclassified Luteococcus TaxID=2639923 RepID=UPI00313CC856